MLHGYISKELTNPKTFWIFNHVTMINIFLLFLAVSFSIQFYLLWIGFGIFKQFLFFSWRHCNKRESAPVQTSALCLHTPGGFWVSLRSGACQPEALRPAASGFVSGLWLLSSWSSMLLRQFLKAASCSAWRLNKAHSAPLHSTAEFQSGICSVNAFLDHVSHQHAQQIPNKFQMECCLVGPAATASW